MDTTRLQIRSNSLNDLPEAAAKLLAFPKAQEIRVWLFEGEMGAGKTTFIKEICKQLQVQDTVQSPTFSIVNEYQTDRQEVVYHFDFYRIKEVEEAVQIGAEEYFYSGALCLIEWPVRVEPLLPDAYLHIQLQVEKDSSRTILITVHE